MFRRAENSASQHHADCNTFAVKQTIGETGRGFKCVAEGMSEIEQCAITGFSLVTRHDLRLGSGNWRAMACSRATSPENISP